MNRLLVLIVTSICFFLSNNLYAEENNPQYPILELQNERTDKHYFKLLLDKHENDYLERVYAIYVYDIQSDSLIQILDVDCAERGGPDNLEVFDYNFDGIDDFSIFEDFYAGPNTSRLYFLRDTDTNKFFEGEISGVCLEFNSDDKTISEKNQCCAGTSVTTAIYTVKNNQMVLIEEHCYKWDDELNDLTERNIEECR